MSYVSLKSPNALPEIVTGDDPAAGAEVSVTVPDGEVWELFSVRVQLVCDATVANRRSALSLTDGTTEFFRAHSIANQTASETTTYQFADMYQHTSQLLGKLAIRIPQSFTLLGGWTVETQTDSLQAGDDYGAPLLYVVKASS